MCTPQHVGKGEQVHVELPFRGKGFDAGPPGAAGAGCLGGQGQRGLCSAAISRCWEGSKQGLCARPGAGQPLGTRARDGPSGSEALAGCVRVEKWRELPPPQPAGPEGLGRRPLPAVPGLWCPCPV
ncbi:neurochondrin [Platysternon megacephalum]|uniref:Neurochondrin n=1 Tax=Platysternon megacephalum TaxID=55544 RepID=A0A4D9ER76_9SAUR|nr:neurochondrin [Platysternon megacephalum]